MRGLEEVGESLFKARGDCERERERKRESWTRMCVRERDRECVKGERG